MRLTRLVGPLSILMLSGCTAWGGALTVEGIPAAPSPAKAFQVWQGDSLLELRAVRIEGDTLHGVPTSMDRRCDSCRVAIAKADVDSIRMHEFRAGQTTWLTIGVIWALLRTGALNGLADWMFGG